MDEKTPTEKPIISLKEQQQLNYLNHLKDIVMRQTDYSEEQALAKLKEHNKDITSIVREFMGGSTTVQKKVDSNKSVNQTIYSEIRSFMDTAAASYEAKKKAEERQQQRQQQYIEQVRKEVERRKQLAVVDSSNVEIRTTTDVTTTIDVNTTIDVSTTPTM